MTHEDQFPEDARNDWPFKKMEINEMVKIHEPELAYRGQIYVHAYGGNSGKKFKTRKVRGVLYVKRIA